MKPVLMFIMESCPYCREALRWLEELKQENELYSHIEIKIVDEKLQPDIANQYDYYYVPTCYVGESKVHEGAASKDIIREVLNKALK